MAFLSSCAFSLYRFTLDFSSYWPERPVSHPVVELAPPERTAFQFSL